MPDCIVLLFIFRITDALTRTRNRIAEGVVIIEAWKQLQVVESSTRAMAPDESDRSSLQDNPVRS